MSLSVDNAVCDRDVIADSMYEWLCRVAITFFAVWYVWTIAVAKSYSIGAVTAVVS